MILLDTDICIELLHGNKSVIERRKSIDDSIAISFITVAELYYGAEKSKKKNEMKLLVDKFLLSVNIIESTTEISKKFGEIKGNIELKGKRQEDADLFIAACTLIECEKLITGNIKHYKNIDKLRIENWIN
jgi:tRNA(fMet)-specific endonuclease VapC